MVKGSVILKMFYSVSHPDPASRSVMLSHFNWILELRTSLQHIPENETA